MDNVTFNLIFRRAFLTQLFLLSIIVLCKGQTSTFPSVIPPSPETASLFSYLDYPVDLSTGQVAINIPIYEVKCGSLTVPISLNYSPRGRKVFDETGPVGIGWTLKAGGEIARTVYAKPDDQYSFPPTLRPAST